MRDRSDFDGDEQEEHLERVSARIAVAIVQFCIEKLQSSDHTFYAEELRKFVVREIGFTAPGSADRVLRDLRQRGVIAYRVLDRRASLYEVIAVVGFPVKSKVA